MYKIRNITQHEFREICQLYYQSMLSSCTHSFWNFRSVLGEFLVYSWPTASDFDPAYASFTVWYWPPFLASESDLVNPSFLPESLPETRSVKPETRYDFLWKTRPDPLPERPNPTRPETRKSATRSAPSAYCLQVFTSTFHHQTSFWGSRIEDVTTETIIFFSK